VIGILELVEVNTHFRHNDLGNTGTDPRQLIPARQFFFKRAKSFAISNSGGGTLNWSANSDVAWVMLSSDSGTDADNIVVSVDTTDMELGTYNGTITVSADDANGSPKTVALTLVMQEDASAAEMDLYLPAARN
jgi:hypothetical protein